MLLICSLFFYTPSICSVHDLSMAELCKYFVAYFELDTRLNYYERLHIADESSFQSLFFPKMDATLIRDNYSVSKLPRKFLQFDVYLVYTNTMHAPPYKIGIDASLNFIRLAGFEERNHISGDTSAFLSYNDKVEFYGLDLFKKQKREIDYFIGELIQLTRYKSHPIFFKLLNNKYRVVEKDIRGNCETVEVENPDSDGSKVLIKKWQYRIPYTGKPSIDILEQKRVENSAKFFE